MVRSLAFEEFATELSKSEFLKREEPATCPIAFKDQSLNESFSEGTFNVLESVQ